MKEQYTKEVKAPQDKVITTIRVPGRIKHIEEILYDNAKREMCEFNSEDNDECWMFPGTKCKKEFQTYERWKFYESKREPKIWNPWSWFGKYYYFYREEDANDELRELANENEKREQLENSGIEYLRLK